MINTTHLDRSYAEHEQAIGMANTGGWKVVRQAARRRPASPAKVAPVLFRVRHWLAPTARTAGSEAL